MIVPVSADAPDLIRRVRRIRDAARVPLVCDPRWPAGQREQALAAAVQAGAAEGAAWATLTSGSSGRPRIVLRSASSWSDSFATVADLLRVSRHDAVALPVTPASSLTLFSIAHALAGGPRGSLGARGVTSATCLHGTPQALQTVLDAGVPPRLRTALIGGSHLDAALRERARHAGVEVIGYYGAAELSFVAIDHGDGLRAFPGVELSIRDSELWVRSPFVASGYAGAAGPLRRDGEWATVGDRAELIDGRLRLLGRADDAILSASATIVPEEVEEVLRTIPGIRDAIVFGLPRERVGALVATLVELDGHPGDLRKIVASRLAPAHRPRRWYAGELPRTASGKPARAEALRRVMNGEVSRLDV
ncbi:AMP-binding protein [Microbacterium sp. C23T]